MQPKSDLRVEIGSPPTKEDLAAWYEKHGIIPDDDGTFIALPTGQTPVSEDGIIEHVRTNAARHEIPNLRGSVFQKATMVFVAGGPSLSDHVEEIRAKCLDSKYDVFTSNNTCTWMLSKGMKPKYHLILDPTERKKRDIEYEGGDDITLVLGLQCHPALFDEAIKRNRKIVKFLAASASRNGESDTDVAMAACTPKDPELIGIGGGTMAGTRMIYLAAAMGYRRIEYYGFDACCKYENGRVRNYAFSKVRNEAVIEVEAANGRKWFSTASLARQAEEIVRLMDNLPGLDVVVHGDSFMSNQVALYKESRRHLDIRATPEYVAMMSQMHEEMPNYGTSSAGHAARVFMAGAQIVRKLGKCDILDYGCGKQYLSAAMGMSFPQIDGMRIVGYDPGINGLDGEPESAEIVVCTDVLEHIEPQCVDAVLKHICSLTKQIAIIVVSTVPARKTLPDGRNAHISLHGKEWWSSFLKKYFVVIEQSESPGEFLAVLQPIRKWIELNKT